MAVVSAIFRNKRKRNPRLIVKYARLTGMYLAEYFRDRRAQRHYVSHELHLRTLPADKLRIMFRIHYYEDFERLRNFLCWPSKIKCGKRVVVSSEFAFPINLCRLASPKWWVDCVHLLRCDRSLLSCIFNKTISALWQKYLLPALNQTFLAREHVDRYAAAVLDVCGKYRKYEPGYPAENELQNFINYDKSFCVKYHRTAFWMIACSHGPLKSLGESEQFVFV